MRLLSASILISVVVLAVWILPVWATAVVAAAAAVLASGELADLAARPGDRAQSAVPSVISAIVTLGFTTGARASASVGDALAVAMAVVVAAGTASLGLAATVGPPLPRAALAIVAPAYLGLPLGAVVWTHWTAGPVATTWLLATVALSDTAQYYCGVLAGRTRLAPEISPGKTVEGAVGGLAAAGAAGLLLGPWAVPEVSPLVGAVVGVALSTFGIIGDLVESLIKRRAGAKDSSTLIPGHGGVLDRIDSYLFAAPVFYIFLRYLR
jgi:phosphatidate cytidylyltransferase